MTMPWMRQRFSKRYLEKAISAVLSGDKPEPATTKAIGCTIKSRS